ncbi:MAG: hypothetical protein K2P41_03545 [Lachnospiraceae bacterium]|nr:hypothetical protein [Lachnospiraceae bacterium]
MATKVQEIARMIDMLPEQEQELAFQLIKRMVLAWDPDFTRVTPDEAVRIHAAEDSGFIPEENIDWNNLSKYEL